jgi:hypothetical protein
LTSATLYDVETVMLAIAVVGLALAALVRRLRRSRPGFAVGAPLVAGLAARLLAVAVVAVTGLGATLRGPDEASFLQHARELAGNTLDSGLWLPGDAHPLHEIVFALQMKLLDAPELVLRITQIGIAMAGIVLILAAVYDLAGAGASRLAGWVLLLEPAGVFFNSILHREPLLVLASGLVVLGGTRLWTRLDPPALLLTGLGCAIAVSTRPYAGCFLIAACLLLLMHVTLRRMQRRLHALLVVAALAAATVVALPAAVGLTSPQRVVDALQRSQNANTDLFAARPGAGTNNLSLEPVDFSTPSAIVQNVPGRIRDLVLRPYPWQLQNMSQQLGALGTLVAYLVLVLLIRYAVVNGRRGIALIAPVLYPAGFLLLAYALSVGNAGTGFRYRTHLVLLGLAAAVVLREHARRSPAPARALESADSTVNASAIRRPQHQPRWDPIKS